MASWMEETVLANGLSQHYYRTGGDKPALILLHGFTESGRVWQSLARAFEDEYDLIMLDARGHGLSSGPETGYSPDILVEDAAAFIRELGLERPYLMGHSNGALTVAGVAAEYPELARAIVLEDPPWSSEARQAPPPTAEGEPWPGFNAWYTSWIDWHKALRTMTPDERIVASKPYLMPAMLSWPREDLLAHLEAQAQFNLDVLDYSPKLPVPTLWRGTVERIECPMLLLLAGKQMAGSGVNSQMAEEIAAKWHNPKSQYHIFPAYGHFLHREMNGEQFEQFVRLVKEFLREN